MSKSEYPDVRKAWHSGNDTREDVRSRETPSKRLGKFWAKTDRRRLEMNPTAQMRRRENDRAEIEMESVGVRLGVGRRGREVWTLKNAQTETTVKSARRRPDRAASTFEDETSTAVPGETYDLWRFC